MNTAFSGPHSSSDSKSGANPDVDFSYQQITECDGTGQRGRVTVLPQSLVPSLKEHLRGARRLHEQDLAEGYGAVYLPFALERKYPNANREWIWQCIIEHAAEFTLDRLDRWLGDGLQKKDAR